MLTYKTKQNSIRFFTRTYKTKHNTDGPFIYRDLKKVSVSILSEKVCLGWKLSPIINRRRVGRLLGTQEYNLRNILLEKSYSKCGGETSPEHFYKKSKLSISLDRETEILYCLFLLLCPS